MSEAKQQASSDVVACLELLDRGRLSCISFKSIDSKRGVGRGR